MRVHESSDNDNDKLA